MARIVGAVDDPRLLVTVVREARVDVEDAERLLARRDEREVVAFTQLVGRRATDGEGDRQRPRQSARQAHVAQHGPVVRLAHEPLERTGR
jgi:hypothetical protein